MSFKHTLTVSLLHFFINAYRATAALLICFLLLSCSPTYEEGNKAYEAGDYETAIRIWETHGLKGNAGAQYSLAKMFHTGTGIPQDEKEAIKWYRLAAEQGNVIAQFQLGVLYKYGEGVLHKDGEGILIDYKEAIKW